MRSPVALAVTISLACAAAASAAEDVQRASPGWGTVVDPVGGSVVKLTDETLVLFAPRAYVDNYPHGKVNAPRVSQQIEGDFTIEVDVVHVDRAMPNSVLPTLKTPTPYHAASLLIRRDDANFVRFERIDMCLDGRHVTRCDLQIWEHGNRTVLISTDVGDKRTRLQIARRGNLILAAHSQNDGETWTRCPQQVFHDMPNPVEVGVSLTSNTDPQCKVAFQGFVVTKP